jgi:hypothetical protein
MAPGVSGEIESGREEDMRLLVKVRHLPPRIAVGTFILNSGVGRLSTDEETAIQLHRLAVGAYPFLGKLSPTDLVRLLAAGEIALGSALLLPIVPAAAAGAGLAVFSGALLGLYARTPGMRKGGGPLPTQQGNTLAKDLWMMAIGLGLIIDDLTDRPVKRHRGEAYVINCFGLRDWAAGRQQINEILRDETPLGLRDRIIGDLTADPARRGLVHS